jgi:hypothetical protein
MISGGKKGKEMVIELFVSDKKGEGRNTRASEALVKLQQTILAGKLRPNERLVEFQLAKKLGMNSIEGSPEAITPDGLCDYASHRWVHSNRTFTKRITGYV